MFLFLLSVKKITNNYYLLFQNFFKSIDTSRRRLAALQLLIQFTNHTSKEMKKNNNLSIFYLFDIISHQQNHTKRESKTNKNIFPPESC